MKSLVVYSSQTGNTRKLAEAVFEIFEGEKEIYPIGEAPDPNTYDFVALGFWLMAGKPDPKILEYLPKIKNTSLFLFSTHGAAVGSEHANNAMNYAKSLASEANISGSYSCQGEVSPKFLEKIRVKPEPPVWLDDAPTAIGHPDQTDIEELKRHVAAILSKKKQLNACLGA